MTVVAEAVLPYLAMLTLSTLSAYVAGARFGWYNRQNQMRIE